MFNTTDLSGGADHTAPRRHVLVTTIDGRAHVAPEERYSNAETVVPLAVMNAIPTPTSFTRQAPSLAPAASILAKGRLPRSHRSVRKIHRRPFRNIDLAPVQLDAGDVGEAPLCRFDRAPVASFIGIVEIWDRAVAHHGAVNRSKSRATSKT
jgi:hypothetical protein